MAIREVARPKSREDFEIAIVCTEDVEYNAVCLVLDGFWDDDGDPFGRAIGDFNTYTIGHMEGFNIVITLLCNSGKATAASTAASLRSSYPRIELLLLTGICDGVPKAMGKELLLGDVAISDTVIQYDLGRRYADGFREKDTLDESLGRPDKNVRNLITVLKTDIGLQRLEENVSSYLQNMQSRASERQYQRRSKATYLYPGSANDMLFESAYCHRHYGSPQCKCGDYIALGDPVCGKSAKAPCEQTGCDKGHLLPRERLEHKKKLEDDGDLQSAQQPSIFIGRFGSGDTSFSAGIDRDRIAQKHNIIAFETEGAGVWDELPCIIVKGVSTYGDGHEMGDSEAWQHFAAATAACAARGLISRYPQTDKSLVLESKNQTDTAFTSQADITCLRDLYITSPPNDKIRIEQTKGGLLTDAYVWILKNDAYKQWIEDANTCLLWIRGDPGKGKTMLLCGIIDQLQQSEHSGNLYYFFCQATDSRLNDASSVLRGLLHTLISRQPSLISYVRKEYDKSGKTIFEDSNSWIVLSQIFFNILGDPSIKGLTFIIDALDECTKDLPKLLKLIRQSSSSSQAQWLVSSRNEANIQDVLLHAENQSIVSLEINSESVSAAIQIYIDHKVEVLSKEKRYQQGMKNSIQKYLTDNADGTFLWVALVCEMLEEAPSFDPSPESARYPRGLDNLYDRMMVKVCSNELDWGRRILSINTVARRPLSIQELETLTFYPANVTVTIELLEKRWVEALGYCGNFLTQRKGVVYFIHQSAKDFILSKASYQLFRDGMEHTHKYIFKLSISVMMTTLKRDIYGLSKPGFLISDLASQHIPSPDPLAPLGYCCVYWIDHFEKSISQSDGIEDAESIRAFFCEKFIYWLEALSLLRSMYQGTLGMQKLEKLSVSFIQFPK